MDVGRLIMANKHDEFAQQTVGWHIQSQAPNPWTVQGNIGSTVHYHQDGGLPNPGYSDGTGKSSTAPVTPAVPASTVLAINTTGFVVTVVITGGTLTVVRTGYAGQTYAQANYQTGTTAGTYVIPPNGVIGITYSAAPTWTWTY
jgi:hypothetical protein